MSNTTSAPFHVGLTTEFVVDAAVDLTRESHLLTWSIRDLAARLGVAPSVIYHHVGGKDLLCRRVVERVFDDIDLPPRHLEWRDWFRTLLLGLGPRAIQYPGTAKWMLMHGPTIPVVLPTLEAGLEVLGRAGFGASANFAYALLLNNAMLTVTIGDDRLQHEGDGPRDHAAMMTEFNDLPDASAGVRAMGRQFIAPFADDGATAAQIRADYYRFVVDTTIAGLATTLVASTTHAPLPKPPR